MNKSIRKMVMGTASCSQRKNMSVIYIPGEMKLIEDNDSHRTAPHSPKYYKINTHKTSGAQRKVFTLVLYEKIVPAMFKTACFAASLQAVCVTIRETCAAATV